MTLAGPGTHYASFEKTSVPGLPPVADFDLEPKLHHQRCLQRKFELGLTMLPDCIKCHTTLIFLISVKRHHTWWGITGLSVPIQGTPSIRLQAETVVQDSARTSSTITGHLFGSSYFVRITLQIDLHLLDGKYREATPRKPPPVVSGERRSLPLTICSAELSCLHDPSSPGRELASTPFHRPRTFSKIPGKGPPTQSSSTAVFAGTMDNCEHQGRSPGPPNRRHLGQVQSETSWAGARTSSSLPRSEDQSTYTHCAYVCHTGFSQYSNLVWLAHQACAP